MAWLKYYEEEHARQPVLHTAKCTWDEAIAGIKKLCRHFKIREPNLFRTSGNRISCANGRQLTLNISHLNWLLVVHELAHTWHSQRHTANPARHFRWHGKTHVRLVDRMARYVLKKEWHKNAIVKPKVERPVPTVDAIRAAKIASRQKQIKRLETRIKSLTTRMKSARRSLAALERAAVKAIPADSDFRTIKVTCPDCERCIGGLWRTGVCNNCNGTGNVAGKDEPCKNCGGTGHPVCCRCEGSGKDPERVNDKASTNNQCDQNVAAKPGMVQVHTAAN